MKIATRTFLTIIALLASLHASANMGSEKAITPDKLPLAAQQTIKTHFPNRKIAIAKVETELFSKSYDVIFTNGEKIEFDKRGNWTEVKCKRTGVPQSLIPQRISQYVRINYPDCKILEIEIDDDEIEITLSNHVEVTFNKKFEVIDIE